LELRKQHCHTHLRKFFFSERVVSWWNLLDADAVFAATVNSFKNYFQRIRQSKRSFFTSFKGSPLINIIPPLGVAAPSEIPGENML